MRLPRAAARRGIVHPCRSTSLTAHPVRPILVAYDGSASARTALSWAIIEAVGSGRALRLAHVMRWPLPELDDLRVPPSVHDAGEARRAASAMIGAAVAHCRQIAPGLDVRGDALTGDAIELLAKLAADASLLVLGASGQTANPQVLLGSSAAELTRRVTVPVAVIRDAARERPRPRRRHRRRRLTGGRPRDPRGLRGRRTAPPPGGGRARLVRPAARGAGAHGRGRRTAPPGRGGVARRPARRGTETHPGVVVDEVVVLDRPVGALLERASGAALLVVGRHGRAGGAETPLGSVCHAVLHYAPCPVMITG